jgi:hypothetical protein
MRMVLGRGVSDPSSMFVDEGKGFLGKLRSDLPLPNWITEAVSQSLPKATKSPVFAAG